MIDLSKRCNLIQGDCLEVLKELPDESIDLVLTDPPYRLVSITKRFGKENSAPAQYGKDGSFQRVSGGFMGKKWDSEFPRVEVWKEVKRVMKAGAFCVFTMTPRQDSLRICLNNLHDAGFNLGHSGLYWLYHSGFPKAMNVAKAIDRSKGLKGEIIGKETIDAGIQSGSMHAGRSSEIIERNVLAPASEEAKQWQGWYSYSPKPAVECIVVAQKPRTEKTIVGQVLKTGTGAVNVDATKIPYANEKIEDKRVFSKYKNVRKGKYQSENTIRYAPEGNDYIMFNSKGRFPANLIVQGNPLLGETQSTGHDSRMKTIGFGKFGGGSS